MRFCLLFCSLFLFAACHSSLGHGRNASYSLLDHFPYASGTRGFELETGFESGKAHPILVQHRSGKIAFYVRVPSDAALKYTLRFQGDTNTEMDARITIESDSPAVKREFAAVMNSVQEIPLPEFANQVTQITFSATTAAEGPLHGSLMWIDPELQYKTASQHTDTTTKEHDFRARHQNDNLLIVLFDAASPLHLACYGYPQQTTPVIDSLAKESVLFENAISQAAFTHASIGTLFTGLYPIVHGTGTEVDFLAEGYRTMAEVFRDAGYRTAMFSGNPLASPIVGYGQGFQMVWTSKNVGASTAEEIVTKTNSWLKTVRNQRFFAYIHFREPHEPYNPPPAFRRLFANGDASGPFAEDAMNYNGNLAYADSEFAKILTQLRSLGIYDRTMIVVMADHGEAFGEHGFKGHVRQVYEEMIRIPLIIRIPREQSLRGMRKRQLVGILDLMPTFLDIFPLSKKEVRYNGSSLLPLILNERWPNDRFLISFCRGTTRAFSLRSQQYKYIQFANKKLGDEFYRLSSDPHEKTNLISQDKILANFYRAELAKELDELKQMAKGMPRSEAGKVEFSEETKEQLRALGYIQ